MSSVTLINKVKYSRLFYNIYFHIGSNAIKVLKFFLKADEKLIVFSSFGGRKYDDSPKAIYEAMLKDPRFEVYELVWAFMRPDDYSLPRGRKMKIDTLTYYKTLLRARVWVTNSSMNRGLAFTGINTFLLNTWHGTPIKVMGSDIANGNGSFRIKRKKRNRKELMLAQSQYDVNVFSRAFHMPKENFCIVGLPRNDELAYVTKEKQNELKRVLGIPEGKNVILYAPTFREYNRDGGNNVVFVPPINLQMWQKRLGKDFVLLFRAHYEVARVMGIEDNCFVKNVSAYPCLNELMLASDLLISDYSSIFFDYSVQGKPMLCYCYDYDKYSEKRGMYFDIREWIPSASDEEALLQLIENTDVTEVCESTRKFKEMYVTESGHASEGALNIIYNNIQ